MASRSLEEGLASGKGSPERPAPGMRRCERNLETRHQISMLSFMQASPGSAPNPPRRRLDHETPHWVREAEEIFFITVCCRERGENALAKSPIAEALLDSVGHRNRTSTWWCSAFVVMPDHVHGLIQFSPSLPMVKAMKQWKAWTARTFGIRWQSQWFDHRLRGQEEWRKKADYLFNNPVRAGLVEEAEEWPWRFFCER